MQNDQTNRKNVSGKTMSNNCAETAWEIDEPIYTECVGGYDLRSYIKNLLMLCFYNLHNKYIDENFE